jgi:hypothetical protein
MVLPTLKYQLKNKYPPLAKTFTKGYHSVVTHVLYNFCDMSLKTACAIFFSLKFMLSAHVLSWRHHLPPDISENDQDSDSDWFTDCIDIRPLTLLFSLQKSSESCFGNDNRFLIPNPWDVLFFISQPFTHSKFCLTNPLLFGATSSINNDRSLKCLSLSV